MPKLKNGDRERTAPQLTARERQIVELIALGRDDKEIAAKLVTSQANVASRIARMFLKYGVHRRAALVWSALAEEHLGPPTKPVLKASRLRAPLQRRLMGKARSGPK